MGIRKVGDRAMAVKLVLEEYVLRLICEYSAKLKMLG